jgi:cell division protein FtsW
MADYSGNFPAIVPSAISCHKLIRFHLCHHHRRVGPSGRRVCIAALVVLHQAGMIARKTRKLFPKYLVLGSALILSVQAFVNMAVAVNLIPVTGQPLPLISRGGTSTLITCAYFGLILSADRFGMGKSKKKSADDETDEHTDDSDHDAPSDTKPDDVVRELVGLEDNVEFEIIHV